jgi:alpha-glucosidase/alpha-D-xyloside xylohydrolase
VPLDGVLVKEDFGKPQARMRAVAGSRAVKCGSLTVTLKGDPISIRVEGGGRLIQELQVDRATGKLTFPTGEAPVLGLGQGGPQFDKRGSLDRMGSGQGGFRLATHGAKVPVPLALGTSGWAMFVHQPPGAFDFTGKEGVFARPMSRARCLSTCSSSAPQTQPQ